MYRYISFPRRQQHPQIPHLFKGEVVGFVRGTLDGDEGPEARGVVEFFEVAEFVDDEVVLFGRFEEEDFV